ncbi:MAG: HIT family protein [Planctomycetes bacterium]|nr:HIT family protein [Planctomycetota bacterium]
MVDPVARNARDSAGAADSPRRGCVFCEILAGRAPGFIVHQNDLAVALLDINPLARGHCLVIPRRHVPWWHELTEAETTAAFQLARTTATRIMAVFQPEFVAMYVRGRRIPHTHIFLVPTSQGEPFDRHCNALEGFQEGVAALARLQDRDQLAQVQQRLGRA